MTDSQSAVRARQYYQQGVAFFQRNQLHEAAEALRFALRTAPDHIDARIQLGAVLVSRGKPLDGLDVIETGLARGGLPLSDQVRLLTQASSCAAAANRYEQARSYLEQTMELGGRPSPHIFNQVAAICCKGGLFDEGFAYFMRAANQAQQDAELL